MLRQQALEQENAQLRELHAALPPLIKKWLVAEVIGVDSGMLRQRLIINKGRHQGVQLNQPVVDSNGILGQVAHVGPWSSEVILITDPEHAIPVQVARNGLRTIAVGFGQYRRAAAALPGRQLRRQERRPADQLGSGRRVPGRLSRRPHHRRAPRGQPAARAGARGTAGAASDRTREVMLIEFDPANPAAPPPPEALRPRPAAPTAEVSTPVAPSAGKAARARRGTSPRGRQSQGQEQTVISRETLPVILLTSIVALVLSILPLPGWLPVFRPAFLVLAVLYWSTMAPFVAGMALGFFGGLALDVFQGSLLGEHALALSFLTYLALRLNLLTRAKPIFEQSLYVLVALLAYELLLWLIDGWTGRSMSSPLRWVHTLIGALIWPVVVGVLGRFHSAR